MNAMERLMDLRDQLIGWAEDRGVEVGDRGMDLVTATAEFVLEPGDARYEVTIRRLP